MRMAVLLSQNNWSISFKPLPAHLLKATSIDEGRKSGCPAIYIARERADVPLILFWTVDHTFKVCFTHTFLITIFFWDCLLKNSRADRGIAGSEFCSMFTSCLCVIINPGYHCCKLRCPKIVFYIGEAESTPVLLKSECFKVSEWVSLPVGSWLGETETRTRVWEADSF